MGEKTALESNGLSSIKTFYADFEWLRLTRKAIIGYFHLCNFQYYDSIYGIIMIPYMESSIC